jgi:hypothetical protein
MTPGLLRSADVGVLHPGEATGPAELIDIATDVRPGARLKRVIADIRLQLAEDVIIHHDPSPATGGGHARRAGALHGMLVAALVGRAG